ncbi:hypothetical protein CCACVL1_16103 [Corchorus capsularis]|uniref:DNA-directed RNA polymerase n=1 Tax=Corchorus capsularis TaxID=210143 RepID=A0A1R3HZE2_COCAP|nr:hypothetical protein CCACVL1_16103 [Corchorus capsularis]
MGVSPDGKGSVGMTSMDLDDNDDMFNELFDVGEEYLRSFCRQTAVAFFNHYGVISHQINSYNDFIKYGLQKTFDSFGEYEIQPDYDPSKKGDGDWHHAKVKFGKVSVVRPTCWAVSGGTETELNMLPRHARLQNMTYSSKMKVEVELKVYTKKIVKSDKFKTGREEIRVEEIVYQDKREIFLGRLPVMVKSDLCWMSEVEKADCDFDHGGYFLIKGADKIFIAQERISLKRLWISNSKGWIIDYRSEVKRSKLIIRLEDGSKVDFIKGGDKVLNVDFLSTSIPVWILFFALGVSSDKEVVNLIDYGSTDFGISNILFASIRHADGSCADFSKQGNALNHLSKLVKASSFPPEEEDMEECLRLYLFPSLHNSKQKARFLGYMVKCLLQAYTGRRKCCNRDDFRNKRFELASELLERELKVHIAHARRRIGKALQRDLNPNCTVRPIEHYLDSAIVTNGLLRAFSTGAWSHPYKKERISNVVANLGRGSVHREGWRCQIPVCFLSTPDGENYGLVKNLATTGLVSTYIVESIVDKLFDSGMEKLVNDTSSSLDGKDKIFLNGEWVGVCEDSLSFAAEVRRKRRMTELPHQVEIKRDHEHKEVRIFTDAGRILRPLLVVENLSKIKAFKAGKNFTFQSLLDKGIVELIGTEEEEDCCTAWV